MDAPCKRQRLGLRRPLTRDSVGEAVDPTTLGGRRSSVPSLHARDDFSCDITLNDGSPIDPGNVVDWRTIGEAFASYVVPVQDELAKAEARPDLRGRINV